MTKIRQTKNCIICLNKATHYSGHVRRGNEKVIAGFCRKHEATDTPNLLRTIGCRGGYHVKYGIMNRWN